MADFIGVNYDLSNCVNDEDYDSGFQDAVEGLISFLSYSDCVFDVEAFRDFIQFKIDERNQIDLKKKDNFLRRKATHD